MSRNPNPAGVQCKLFCHNSAAHEAGIMQSAPSTFRYNDLPSAYCTIGEHNRCDTPACPCSHHRRDHRVSKALMRKLRRLFLAKPCQVCGMHETGETWDQPTNRSHATDGKTFDDIWGEYQKGHR